MKYAIAEVEVVGGKPGASMSLATVNVTYRNMTNNALESVPAQLVSASFTDSPGLVEASTKKEVMAAAVYQIGVERNIMAMRLRDEGKVDEAARMFQSNASYLYDSYVKLGDEHLNEYSYSNRAAASNLDPSLWNLQRKKMREEQHEIVTQQSGRGSSK